MPRLKKEVKKVKKEVTKVVIKAMPRSKTKVVEIPRDRVVRKVEVEVKVVTVPALPFFENAQVLKILEDDRHTSTHYHCRMDNGTTQHVPRKLFV